MKYIMTCALASLIVLSGCSTFKADPNKTVEVPANKLDNIPQWYLAKDPDDNKFIVVTATDTSKDMQFAIDKATINAKIQIAERLKTDVNSVTRESTLENGQTVEREIDRVSKVQVKQAIGFFKRENVAVFKEGDVYRAYVQFKIATEDAQRLTRPANTGKTRDDRFKNLDEEPAPAVVSAVQPRGIELLPVENEEYKKRREEALQKPGAVIGQTTIR
jgi:hypothetical protein